MKSCRVSAAVLCSMLLLVSVVFSQEDASTVSPEIKSFALNPDQLGAIGNSVNLFTGDVNLPINLVTLSGPNGLDVNVTATYNSNVHPFVDTWNLEAPTGILGLGWSLDYEKIIVDEKGTGTHHDNDYYLISGGSSNKLVCAPSEAGDPANTRRYKPKNYQFWDILYYYQDERWEITLENGNKKIFGGGINAYPPTSTTSTGNAIQWGVKWGNWIGESALTIGQSYYVQAWNIVKIQDQWKTENSSYGNEITFDYMRINSQVGLGGKYATEASYLSKITDAYDRYVEFHYQTKGANEYLEPHQEVAYNSTLQSYEPDAYQERYEKLYLDELVVYNASDTELFTVDFTYTTQSYYNGTNNVKKLLTSITHLNPSDHSLPNLQFTYVPSGQTNEGALKEVKLPMGAIVEFGYGNYQFTGTPITNIFKSFTDPGGNWYNPKINVAQDYAVITWYDSDSEDLLVRAYIWDGNWIEQELGTISDVGHVSGHTENQKFQIRLEEDFFAILKWAEQSTQTKSLHIWKKNSNIRGGWIASETISIDMGTGTVEDKASFSTGDNFVVVSGITYAKLVLYNWDGEDWVVPTLPNVYEVGNDNSYVASANLNYFIYNHSCDNIIEDLIGIYHMHETGEWDFCYVPDGYCFNGGLEPIWHVSNTFAIAMVPNISEYLYTWDSDYNALSPLTIGGVLSDSSPVYFSGYQINIDVPYPSCKAFVYRYDGSSFNGTIYTPTNLLYRNYSFAYDYFLVRDGRSSETHYWKIFKYDPNATSSWWSSDNLTSALNAPYMAAGNSYFIFGENAYYKNPSGGFTQILSPLNEPLQSGQGTGDNNWIANNFVVYEFGTSQQRQLVSFKNGEKSEDKLLGTYNNISLSNSMIVGEQVVNGMDFYRYGEYSLFSKSAPYDYPVVSVTVTNGGEVTSTYYEYETSTALLDKSCMNVNYNKVIVTPGNATTKPYGYTTTYFFNGLSRAELTLGSQFPANDANTTNTTNAENYYNLLKGMPYKTITYNSNGIEKSSTTTYYFTEEVDLGSKDVGTYVRPRKTVTTTDDLTQTTYMEYNANNGLLEKTKVIDNNNKEVRSYTAYAFEHGYDPQGGDDIPALFTEKNMLSQVAYTSVHKNTGWTQTDGSMLDMTRTYWTDFYSPVTGLYAPERMEKWTDDGDHVNETGEWLSVTKPKKYNNRGQLVEAENIDGIRTTTVLGYDDMVPVATVTNATSTEVIIDDFGDGDYAGWSGGIGTLTSDSRLKIEYTTNTSYGSMSKAVNQIKDIRFDCDVEPSTTTNTFYISLRTSSAYVALSKFTNDGTFRAYTTDGPYGGNITEILFEYEANKNYHITYEVHTDQDQWTLWINGEVYGPFYCLTPASAYVTNIVFYDYNTAGYPGYATVDNVRLYPSDAFCTSTSYDPLTLQVTSQTDEAGVSSYMEYDEYNRPYRTLNDNKTVITQTTYYYSRSADGNYYSNAPNYVETNQLGVVSRTFTDALGRTLQTHTYNGNYAIVTMQTYNVMNKIEKSYHPKSLYNPGHTILNPSTSGWPYDLTSYKDDPRMRIDTLTNGDGKVISYDYGTETLSDLENKTYFRTIITDPKAHDDTTYTDMAGNIVYELEGDTFRWSKHYDLLGRTISVEPPNYYQTDPHQAGFISEMGYNTLGGVTWQDTPDEGKTKYIYLRGHVKFSQSAAQRANGGRFTVYYYDGFGRETCVGEEMDDFTWVNDTSRPDSTNTTYGTEAGEWKVKKYYDTPYSESGLENYCYGQLTKTEINDDADNSPEHWTTYRYDKNGNILEKRISIAEGEIAEKVIQHVYDEYGRETQLIYPSGKIVYKTYNSMGQLESIRVIE